MTCGPPARLAWQVHRLRRLQKEVTGRVRSLRFFENVRKLQLEGEGALGGAGSPSRGGGGRGGSPMRDRVTAPRQGSGLALLSCCGHVGECGLVTRAASEQLCHMAPACKAPARPSCVVPVSELGTELSGGGGGSSGVGAKLTSVISLIKRIPRDERILVFVQFQDLLERVDEALRESGVAAVRLWGTPMARSSRPWHCRNLSAPLVFGRSPAGTTIR